ncbi:hypothetical protein DSO57_1025663 [Entomophthora muscae]|uniref:Uncharacterized protein n=1 Tax=Entomophthora muscae TaxID=34485 RepID=A0ACC2SF83_9FUNG|nr:hypothetical protein DSO57_1025663 [Entomophthora muscae]
MSKLFPMETYQDLLGPDTREAFWKVYLVSVTEVTIPNPAMGFEPAPSHQAGGAGSRSLPAPGFALKSKYPGAGTTPSLAAAVGPILGPKSFSSSVGLAGPGQAKFSCPELPVQAHPPFDNLGFPVGNPFLIKFFCLRNAYQAVPKMAIKL